MKGSEISTRIWLDERLWNEVTNRAVNEGTTVRELIPQLVRQSLTVVPRSAQQAGFGLSADSTSSAAAPPSVESQTTDSGLPVLTLSDVYSCGVCGAEIRLGGVSQHMNKHKKEREAAEAERS